MKKNRTLVGPGEAPRNRKLTRAALLVGGLSVVLVVSGCSSEGDGSNGGKTVLKVQGWKGGGTEPANIAAIVSAFEKANPDIDVQFEYVPPNDAYLQKLQPQFLAGKAADVVMTDVTKIPGWSKAGYLMDLSSEPWVSKADPAVVPSISVDSKVYGQPMEIIAEGLYVNTDLLKKAGISEAPTTWPQFEKDLATLKAKGITPIAFPNKAGDTAQMVLNAAASTLTYQDEPDWDKSFNSGQASFTQWKPALDQIKSLQSDGYVDFKQSLGVDEWSQGLNDFAAGKYAFWFHGAWEIQALQKAGLKNFTFNPWPAATEGGKSSVGVISGTQWSINAQTKKADAAKKFLAFWSDPDNAKPFLEAEHAFSPWKGATNPNDPVAAKALAAYEDNRFHVLPRDSWLSASGNKSMKSKLQAWMLGRYSSEDELLKDLDNSLRPSS
ncbi:extracellular solute-binding protein [Streptomyces sp. NPDC006976]|uniref:ABC transporter substrate-binding protein n=1 Tax=Streptomyces sp. NPDC006976 TaxID=3154311 RepID=UPI0033DD2903